MITNRKRLGGLEFSAFAGAFVFGVVMSSLGSILPALFASIGFAKTDAGQLFLVMNFAMLISSILFGPICDRFGFRVLLAISTLLVAGSFVSLSGAASYRLISASLFVLGFGGGALNGATNALVNDISPDRRQSALNMLGIYFGCGALLMPFFIGSLLNIVGLHALLLSLAVLTLGTFFLFLVVEFPRPKLEGGFSRHELVSLLKDPLLLLFGLLLFFQSGNEFTVGGWVSTFLEDSRFFDARGAAFVLAGYWAAMMLGRLAASRFGATFTAPSVVIGSALTAMAACAVLTLTASRFVAALCVVLIGTGFAAIFPTTLAQAGTAFARYSGTAFSVIFMMALTGGMSAPWLFGRIAQSRGVGMGFRLTVLSCASIAAIQSYIRFRGKRFTSAS